MDSNMKVRGLFATLLIVGSFNSTSFVTTAFGASADEEATPQRDSDNALPIETDIARPPGHPGGHPGHGNPGHGNPGHGNPGHGNPGHGNPGHGNPGHGNPGHGNPGHGGHGSGHVGSPRHFNPGHHAGGWRGDRYRDGDRDFFVWDFGPWAPFYGWPDYYGWRIGLDYYIPDGLKCYSDNTAVAGEWMSDEEYYASDDAIYSALGMCENDPQVIAYGAEDQCRIRTCTRY